MSKARTGLSAGLACHRHSTVYGRPQRPWLPKASVPFDHGGCGWPSSLEVRTVCLNWACTGLCGGRLVTAVPTAIVTRGQFKQTGSCRVAARPATSQIWLRSEVAVAAAAPQQADHLLRCNGFLQRARTGRSQSRAISGTVLFCAQPINDALAKFAATHHLRAGFAR